MTVRAESRVDQAVRHIRSALIRLNPTSHEADISWPSLTLLHAEIARLEAEVHRLETALAGEAESSSGRAES